MIRLKLIIRNIFGKPFRSIIMILSLAAAAFAALFCISGMIMAKESTADFFHEYIGDSDIMIFNVGKTIEVSPDDFPAGSRYVELSTCNINISLRNPKYYNYVTRLNVNVVGTDVQKAYDLRLFREQISDSKDGVVITQNLADRLNKKVGDTISFYGNSNKEYHFKIVQIAAQKGFLNQSELSIVTNIETANRIADRKKDKITQLYVDVPDEQVESSIADISQKYPDYVVFGTKSAESEDMINSSQSIYYLIFFVVVLMVAFLILSMTKHIINERMSSVGMLRSIGGSIKGTSGILFAENVFYGLSGGIIGSILFLILKNVVVFDMFQGYGMESADKTDGINFFSVTAVIAAVTLLPCLCSAASILKAAKTPVRDIIFGTKETAYTLSKPKVITGAVLFGLGIILSLIAQEFELSVLSIIMTTVGAVLAFPWVITAASKAGICLFDKLHMPIAKLAMKETSSKKSNISSSQLIISAVSLTVAVMVVALSVIQVYASNYYNCDIVMTNLSMQTANYEYIASTEGVEGIEMLYYTVMLDETRAYINDVDTELYVVGYQDSQYFKGILNAPAQIAEDEVVFDKKLASHLGLHIGDTVNIKLKTDTYLPQTLTFKITSLCDSVYFNTTGTTILINQELYKSLYFDHPAQILIKTEPGKTADVLSMLDITNSDDECMTKTVAMIEAENEEAASGIVSILYALIVIGLFISILGTASNVLIGFEQSKRKYAVLYSTSMSRAKLKKLIICETAALSGISVFCSVIFGIYLLEMVSKALSAVRMSVPLFSPGLYAVIFGIIVFALLMLITIKPVSTLSKMNISQEIKIDSE